MTTATPTTTDPPVEAAAALFAALAHPGRLRMLAALLDGGSLPAGTLAAHAGLEQTAASHQLRLLRQARLLHAHRSGRHILYSLADHHVAHIIHDAIAHASEPG